MNTAANSRPPARAALVRLVLAALDDMKAVNVKAFDVREATDVTDCMVVASGTSDRHVRSIADRVVGHAKAKGFAPLGVEGERDGEWVLVDLNDVIVHVMLPRVREFYALENLWDTVPALRTRSATKPAARAKAGTKAKAKAKTKTGAKTGAKAKAKVKAKAKTGTRVGAKAAPASRRATPRTRTRSG